MANETEQQQNATNKEQQNGNVKQGVKGYRKKGLVSEKVLLERLSDMSIEDNVMNPVITLSSVEGDDDCDPSPMEECDSPRLRSKATLKPSLSLDVPNLKIENEAKRPPLLTEKMERLQLLHPPSAEPATMERYTPSADPATMERWDGSPIGIHGIQPWSGRDPAPTDAKDGGKNIQSILRD